MATIVHIGWPKTATSWLQEKVFVEALGYDQTVPRDEIVRQFVVPDQISFDTAGVRADLAERADGARRRGLVPVISHERLCGVLRNRFESTVFGERLVSVVPNLKVFFVVREQRDAMLSAWQQYVRDGGVPATGPSVKSLGTFYGDEATRRSVMPPVGDLKYFEYDRLLQWYVGRIGRENVLVLPLEQLRTDPHGFYVRVARFSGVDPSGMPDFGARNEAWAPLTYGVKRRLNYLGYRQRYTDPSSPSRYQGVMTACYQLDRRLPRRLRRVGKVRLERAVDHLAGDHFVSSNRRLQELVDWDVRAYGYML